jgi:hypothetical protein
VDALPQPQTRRADAAPRPPDCTTVALVAASALRFRLEVPPLCASAAVGWAKRSVPIRSASTGWAGPDGLCPSYLLSRLRGLVGRYRSGCAAHFAVRIRAASIQPEQSQSAR